MDEKRLERIELKIDDLDDHLATINVILARQNISLEEHVRRTNILEDEIKPIRSHVAMVQGGIKLLVLVATIIAILSGLKAIH